MLLKVENLNINLKKDNRKIIKNISFEMQENTCLGILGESGSGKSITCKSILNILNDKFNVNGNIFFENKNLINLSQEESRKIRGKDICMILQNPMTSFDPLYTIENQMIEKHFYNIYLLQKKKH